MITSTTFHFYPTDDLAELSSNSAFMSIAADPGATPCYGGPGCDSCVVYSLGLSGCASIFFPYLATLPPPTSPYVELTISHSSHPELFL